MLVRPRPYQSTVSRRVPGGRKREETMVTLPLDVASLPGLSLLLTALAAGCEAEKSENPLSPSVAGPIAGVEITAPRASEPALGAKLKDGATADSTDGRERQHERRPAAVVHLRGGQRQRFPTKVFGRSTVPPGTNGKTTITLDPLAIGQAYHWRARAEDGANTGPFMTAPSRCCPSPISTPAPSSRRSTTERSRPGSRRC